MNVGIASLWHFAWVGEWLRSWDGGDGREMKCQLLVVVFWSDLLASIHPASAGPYLPESAVTEHDMKSRSETNG